MRNVWRWGVAAGIVAAAAALAYRQFGNEETPAAPAATTSRVELRTLEISVEASGTIEPIRVVEVKSRASGEVERVLAETGDLVEAGALLAEIDPRDVQNALEQAEADVASARVKARVVSAQLERMRELVAGGVVPQQDLDSAEDSAASAEASVLRAETNLSLAKERRSDVTIRAPIAGTILDRQIEPGQIIASATANVSGGTSLFRMADLSAMRVRAHIDETDIGRIHPGQPVRLTVEAYPGRTFAGSVEKIEPQAVTEQNVTQFPVLVRLDNAERLLLPGMSAEINLEIVRREGALAVPNGAVVGSRDVDSAATAAGIDPETARAALRGDSAAGAAGAKAPEGVEPAAGGSSESDCESLRSRLRAGGGFETLSDAERTRLRECREKFGGGPAAARTGRPRTEGSASTAALEGRRPGLLFVVGPGGAEPRRVVFGLSDWEYTEVLEGASAGESVLLVTVAQIQRQQRELEQRVRERAGGGITGGAAPAGGTRGR